MLVGKDLYSKIDEIVERSYLSFAFMLIGADMLSEEQKKQVESLGLIVGRKPLIELLYMLIRNRPTEGYRKDATLSSLLDSIASMGILPVINDAQQATLDTGKASMHDAVENTKQEIRKKIRQQVVEMNKQHRQEVAVRRIDSAPQVKDRGDALRSKLLETIPALLLTAKEAFERSFSSSLTDFINDSVVDSATADSLFTGVSPKDVMVYKKVVDDASLCRWCRRLYSNADGSPRLFTLSELQSNGSNYGKKKSEWKATISKTHPRCRCLLFYRKPS